MIRCWSTFNRKSFQESARAESHVSWWESSERLSRGSKPQAGPRRRHGQKSGRRHTGKWKTSANTGRSLFWAQTSVSPSERSHVGQRTSTGTPKLYEPESKRGSFQRCLTWGIQKIKMLLWKDLIVWQPNQSSHAPLSPIPRQKQAAQFSKNSASISPRPNPTSTIKLSLTRQTLIFSLSFLQFLTLNPL